MLNRRGMLAVCGVTAAGAVLPKAAVKAVERKESTSDIPKDIREYFAEFGDEWKKEHPLTKEGRQLCDFSKGLHDCIQERYPGGKIVGIEQMQLGVDFDDGDTPVIFYSCWVRVAPAGSDDSFLITQSLRAKLDFFEGLHKLAS